MTAHDDRARDDRARDDRARDEQPAPTARPVLRCGLASQHEAHEWDAAVGWPRYEGDTRGAAWKTCPGQPAPAAREIPADELAEAEAHLRERLATCKRSDTGIPQSLTDHAIETVLDGRLLAEAEAYIAWFGKYGDEEGRLVQRYEAEYDERGRELERLRFKVRGYATDAAHAELERDELGRERDAARAEVEEVERSNSRLVDELERLHTWAGLMSLLDEHYPADIMTGESSDPGARIVVLMRVIDELRTRDEPAQAVVKAFAALRANEALMQAVLLPPWLVEVLGALARAHEDGGRDW